MGRRRDRDGRREAVAEAARGVLFVALWLGTVGQAAEVGAPDPGESTLAFVESYMARAPVPWPQAWQVEYLRTVRQAIASDANLPQYTVRLEILRQGFPPYWDSLARTDERALFEVQAVQVRWYVEHLMRAELPDAQAKQRLREQYTDLWNHAASSLLTQFPFLDPNGVQAAKAESLAECVRDVNAPLLPIFLRPFSDEQIEQIKQRWHDLRHARVDLWRQLSPQAAQAAARGPAPPLDAKSSRLLAQRSLAQLLGQVWSVGSSPPDYYRAALRNRLDTQRRAVLSQAGAAQAERALERRYARQLAQTEQISFLLAALLETARLVPSEQPDREDEASQGDDPSE